MFVPVEPVVDVPVLAGVAVGAAGAALDAVLDGRAVTALQEVA